MIRITRRDFAALPGVALLAQKALAQNDAPVIERAMPSSGERLPAVGLGALYSYNSNFHTYTLDATLVIAVTYLFSAIAVVILPWRKPDLLAASPASRIRLLGVPVIPAAGVVTIGLLGYCLYEWLSNDAYGVNNHDSLLYMLAMYVLALVIYLAARVIRGRQGIDLSLINKEIPVE